MRPSPDRLRRPAAALAIALATGWLLALSAPATAQVVTPPTLATAPVPPPSTSAAGSRAYFPTTGFRIANPTFLSYFQQAGGVRTFGYPVSNEFQLLGSRVQIFQRGVLQARPDGNVRTLNLLADDVLPLAGASGANFPVADPDLVAASPSPDSDDYLNQALDFVAANVPDSWNDLPVNFLGTFRGTVSCDDLGPGAACDELTLGSRALDVWGLPTSEPAIDPDHPDIVYQRFERGILQYSGPTGVTQWLLLGELFRKVLTGANLPSDVQAQVASSRFYAQYDPASAGGLARPLDLPDTTLADAFVPQPIQAGNGSLPTGARPTPVVRTRPGSPSDDVSGPLTAGLGGQPNGDQPVASPQPAGSLPATPGPVGSRPSGGQAGSFGRAIGSVVVQPNPASDADADPPAAVAAPTSSPSPMASGVASAPTSPTPSTPLGPDPCAGDEQILFAPLKPYIGTDVLVAATSATHHDVRTVRLTGPVKPGPVSERPGLNGWVWEWTINPVVEGWYQFTFYVDDARACATSGFNALPAFGAPPTPTAISQISQPTVAGISTPPPTPTLMPTSTLAPTATPVPPPSLAADTPADPACGAAPGQLLRLSGTNLGTSQAAASGNVLFAGAGGTHVSSILFWGNSAILVVVPSGLPNGVYQLVVTTATGATAPVAYHVGSC